LSAFTVDGLSYVDSPEDRSEKSMYITLGKVLKVGTAFYHEYDFGSTTELSLKVVGEREGKVRDKSVQVLARNDPPAIMCAKCEKPATQVCVECLWSGDGWLCDECAAEHGCGEEMLLPVVNSPRVGVCGYTG